MRRQIKVTTIGYTIGYTINLYATFSN